MKTLKVLTIFFFLCFCCYSGSAQQLHFREPDYNQPKLFASWPEAIPVQIQYLEAFLATPVGQQVSIRIGASSVAGTVVSKSDPSDASVHSVVVRSTNFEGASLTFTRVTGRDGSNVYRGRIISRHHSDAFELAETNGNHQFIKKHQLRLLNE